ncbi:MAG: hypothetical protein V3S08_04580, partial [Phycisphaerales bacterium]
MRIGLDVMGGDNAPDAILDGAIGSLDSIGKNDEIVLVGDAAIIENYLKDRGVDDPRLMVVATTEVIAMAEPPVEAVRTKKDSSIVRLAQLAGRKADRPLDGMISAGNTGAVVAAAQMFLRRLPGVHRPGVAV